ncbi:MAG: hypothetical protein LBC20_17110 [Planctomycetaceae bacterium]|nr:hypothetical protein [Planctomycetaceae bacterium]
MFTQGNPDSGKFQTCYDYTKHIFQLLEFGVKDVVVIAGTRNKTVSERKELHDSIKKHQLSISFGIIPKIIKLGMEQTTQISRLVNTQTDAYSQERYAI